MTASACTDGLTPALPDIPSTPTTGGEETTTANTSLTTVTPDPTVGDATSNGTTTADDPTTGRPTTGVDETGADESGGSTSGNPTTGSEESSGGGEESSGGEELCGNDLLDDGEDCDGVDLGGADCASAGFDVGDLACGADCTFDTSGCVLVTCGDGAIDGKDVCDGDDLGGQDCIAQGFLGGGTLACQKDCAGFDTSGCIAEVCSDDMVEGAEVCDGADLNGQDCLSQGFAGGGTLACAADCSAYDTSGCVAEVCGDDTTEGAEVCDGADLGGETCESQGFAGGGTLACAADCSGFDTSACVENVGDCCAANGTVGCEDTSCEATICADDPFCCDTLWDEICANAALTECAACAPNVCGDDAIGDAEVCDGTDLGGASCETQGLGSGTLACAADCAAFDISGCSEGTSDCCENNGTPGCEDATCETTICALDPFCCDTEWDQVCADAAATECAECASGNVCGDDAIGDAEVCDGTDLGVETCETQGFGGGGTLACAADCAGFDTSGCIAAASDCCEGNGTPGCDDATCEATVCDIDSFCCDSEWDVICANVAADECGALCI